MLTKASGGAIRLDWLNPVMDDGSGVGERYTVWQITGVIATTATRAPTTSATRFTAVKTSGTRCARHLRGRRAFGRGSARGRTGSITQADTDCVNDTCTFATVTTVANLCARLFPDPHNDKCEQAEACQSRVADAGPILSQCTSNSTVEQSRAEADALLCSPTRNQATCTRAQCEAEEINTGAALLTNSLRLVLQWDGSLRLTWQPPYGTSDLGPPRT